MSYMELLCLKYIKLVHGPHLLYITSDTPSFGSNDGSDFTGSVFQKVNSKLETGVQLNWTAGSNATKFGLAAKYTPDKDTTIRVRSISPKQHGLDIPWCYIIQSLCDYPTK